MKTKPIYDDGISLFVKDNGSFVRPLTPTAFTKEDRVIVRHINQSPHHRIHSEDGLTKEVWVSAGSHYDEPKGEAKADRDARRRADYRWYKDHCEYYGRAY